MPPARPDVASFGEIAAPEPRTRVPGCCIMTCASGPSGSQVLALPIGEYMTKKIVDARADKDGDITHVKFAGNERFTSVDRAIPMADRGDIENAHVVRRTGAKTHLRTNPDARKGNNLDDMAGDN